MPEADLPNLEKDRPMTMAKDSMKIVIKKCLQISAVLAAVIVASAGIVLAWLVYPGTPGRSQSLKFEGYIELPRHGVLNVLDFLILHNHILFITDESSGSVFKVELNPGQSASGTVSEMTGGGGTHGIALLPGQNVAFVTRSEENTVDVFDPRSLQRLGRIPVAEDSDAILYDPQFKLIYVANGEVNLATLIDPEKRVTTGTIPLGGKPEFVAVDSKTGLLYQNLGDLSSVVAIDLGKRSIMGRWKLAPCEGPSGIAIDSDQRRLFAVCSANALLVVFDLDAHRVVTAMKIGGGPDSVAFDQALHRIYTAGKAGWLTVIQQNGPNSYKVLDNIHTHYGAHTLTVDTASHDVYVGYASLFVRPRIAVFSPTLLGPTR